MPALSRGQSRCQCFVVLLMLVISIITTAQAQVSGIVFRDYNANSVKDTYEGGVASLTVTAFFNTTTATAISTTAGAYVFTTAQIPNATPVQLEFSGIPTGDFSGPFSAAVAGNGTSVQFVTAGASTGAKVDVVGGISQPCIRLTTGGPGDVNHKYDFGLVAIPCSLIATPTVSGCYSNNAGSSKATVSVEVSWANATISPTADNISDAIIASYAGQTRTVNPGPYTSSGGNGTIVSPQVVCFEVDLPTTVSEQVVSASFTNAASCSTVSGGVTLPAPCPPTACTTGQLGGTVYNDFDADGTRDTGELTGISGVSVTVIACDGTVYTTTTDQFGRYTLAVPTTQYPVRVQFGNLPAYAGNGTQAGANGKTTVQFVNGASCTVDLGVLNPTDYCQANPKIIVPCYLNGDPANAGSAADAALVAVNYDLTGTKTVLATIPQVGAVWGTTYNKFDNNLYSAAFLRRHVGLTLAGLGGIFRTDMATNTTTLFVDVETIGVNLGSIGSNASRGLRAKTAPSADAEAFAKVGKVGMGDLDISEDGQTLYFVNLFTKSLLRLSVSNPTTTSAVVIPTPPCVGGESRPWGMAIYKGQAYVGMVCDASVSGNKSDLRAYVYAYDLTTNTFNPAPVFDFPLTYPKGYPADLNPSVTGWFPWTDNTTTAFFPVANFTGYGDILVRPEPILADLEFDVDGSMILSFADRFAFQTGQQNFNTNGTGTYSSVLGGDILRAYFNGSTFILENNAKAGPLTGSGPNNNQGPGFGEFYNDNFFLGNRQPHSENATGGLALKPGSGEVVYAAMDPANSPNAGGFRKVSNQTGLTTGAFSVYIGDLGQGLFAKSAGIGDPSLSCGQPNYLQIGNRVWRDTNNDGFQDPCEPPISGATVVLYNAAKTQVLATATTNANGEYYFANTALTTASTSSAVATTALVANTAYALVVTSLGTGTATNGLTLANVSPTPGESGTLNSGQTPINNDAKPDVVGGVNRPCIRLTTGPLGSVNHTYDFGFSLCVPPSLTALASSATVCQGSFVTLTAQVSPAGSYTYNITGPAGATISAGTSATAVATGLSVGVNTFTITAGNSPACFTTATVSVTVVAPPVVTLTSATVCAGQPASLTASGGGVGATYVFSSTGGVGTVLTITPAVTTPYTVTATTSGGCPATATATVTVLPQPDAGLDQLLVCGPLGITPVSTTLAATPGGGTWTNAPGNPTAATFLPDSASTTVTGLAAGTYQFIYTTPNTCSDVVTVTVPVYVTFCAELTATATASSSTLSQGQPVTLTANVSQADVYTYAWNGPGTITPINAATVIARNTFTVTVTSSPGCFTTATVSVTVLTPALAVTVGTPVCNTLTNNYTASGMVSLINAQAGSLTITDNGTTIAVISVTAGQTSATFTATGVSGSSPASHTFVATLSTATASITYATPASCTVCSLSITTGNLPNGQVSTAYAQTIQTTGGTAPLTFAVTGGSLPAGLNLDLATGVISGTPTASGTTSFSAKVTDGKACSALVPLSIITSALPVCSLTVTATPTICNTVTNQYDVTGSISTTNTSANQSLTIALGGVTTTVTLTGNGPVSYTLTGLNSDGIVHTVTVTSSATACGTASVTYTAPASCSVAPPALTVSVTTPVCNSATNQYTATGTVSLSNMPAGTILTVIDNSLIISTQTLTAGQTTASLSGVSDASSHTVVASLTGGTSGSVVYATPASCTVCSLSVTISSLPNGQVSTAYAQTLTTTGGTAPLTFVVVGGSLPAGLNLDPETGVILGTPISATASSFSVLVTDAKSCSVLVPLTIIIGNVPVCSLTATTTPTNCNTATNTYMVTGTVSATNTPANQSLTVSVGSEASTVVTLTGNGPVSYTLTGLQSGTATKTVTVLSSATACGTASVTYAVPVSCTTVALASLGDKVFTDVNGNGIQDVGDTPIPGVIVTLIQTGTVVATTTTLSSGTGVGCYSFTGLTPGVPYSVSFTTPAGFTASPPLSGTDTTKDSNPVNGITAPITLTAGENNPTIDAGFIPLRGSLGDFVWKEVVQDGKYDPGTELGVANIMVKLLEVTSPVGAPVVSTSLVSTTVTNGAGKYLFSNLPAGRYVVEFVKTSLPANCLTSPDFQKPGVPNALNSDADPYTGLSPIITIVPTDPTKKDILTVDAALIVPGCKPICVPITVKRVR